MRLSNRRGVRVSVCLSVHHTVTLQLANLCILLRFDKIESSRLSR